MPTAPTPRPRWSAPAFIDGDGGLSIHESIEEAAAYLEPADIGEPAIIYDSKGTVWKQIVDGQRIRLVPATSDPRQSSELADKLRQLLRRRRDDDWLTAATLDALVAEAAIIGAAEERSAQRGCRVALGALFVAIAAVAALVWVIFRRGE